MRCTSPVFAQQGALPAGGPFQIPLKYDALTTPVPIVQLRIKGVSLPFVLDTGTSVRIVLDTWAASQLHLPSGGHKELISPGDKAAEVTPLKQVELLGRSLTTKQESVIPFPIEDALVADLGLPKDFSASSRIAGIVGISFFASWTVQLDFAKQTLTLLPPAKAGLRTSGATPLPLKVVDTRFAVTAKSSTGKPIDLLVDTGCLWLVMPEIVAQQFQLLPTPLVLADAWGVAGIQTCKMVLMRTFQVGNLSEANLAVAFQDGGPNLLGMNFLSRFRMTVDFKHQELLLERSADYTQRVRLPGLPSVLMAKQHGEYIVYDLLPDSAAAKAGVQMGDIIVKVDGQDLSTLLEGPAQNVLNGYADTKVEIVVKGAGRQPIHYTRQSLFAMSHGRGIGIGIGVTLAENGALLIETVDVRSPAQEAGLQAGDEITAINGLPVRTTPLDRLAAEMKKPEGAEVRVQILHKGSDKPQEVKLVMRKLL